MGIDGSPASDAALGWAARTAEHLGCSLEVVLAWEAMAPFLAPHPPRAELERQVEATARQALDDAVADLAVETGVDPVLVQGPASATLIDRAADATLLVVGAHGHRGVVPGLGSTAARCAVGATVPAVVVPAEGVTRPTGPVLVGIDGSASGLRALRVAAALARPDQTLRLVHAWTIPTTGALDAVPLDPVPFEEAGRAALDHAAGSLPPDDVARAERVLRSGDARAVLGEEIGHASLAVVGTRGHSPFLHRLLGSTVTYLLHHHEAPVAVVPEEAEGWEPPAGS